MNYERLYDCAKPRHRVWCKSSELTAGTGAAAGTYTLNDAALAAELGEGSEIIVMDKAGMILYWDAAIAKAYDWTPADGGESMPRAEDYFFGTGEEEEGGGE